MVFHLKVIGGADDGTSHRVEPGENIVGKAPTAKIQLRDESIAWEHVMVKDAGSRLAVVNLAAAGTKVRGKRITEETRIASGEEIVLSPKVKMIAESRAGGIAGGMGKTTVLLLVIVLLLLLGMGAAFVMRGDGAIREPPMTDLHWRQAYVQLTSRMERWTAENRFPREALDLFRDAWRLEQAKNTEAAYQNWNRLLRVLNGLNAPNSKGLDSQRITQAAGPDPTSLKVVMGWGSAAANAQANADSDETLADALVWFVRKKSDILGRQLKD